MRPTTPFPRHFLTNVFSHINNSNAILAMDSNAHNTLWKSARIDEWDMLLEEMMLQHNLILMNKDRTELDFVPLDTSFVDISAGKGDVAIGLWHYLHDPLCQTIRTSSSISIFPTLWQLKRLSNIARYL